MENEEMTSRELDMILKLLLNNIDQCETVEEVKEIIKDLLENK